MAFLTAAMILKKLLSLNQFIILLTRYWDTLKPSLEMDFKLLFYAKCKPLARRNIVIYKFIFDFFVPAIKMFCAINGLVKIRYSPTIIYLNGSFNNAFKIKLLGNFVNNVNPIYSFFVLKVNPCIQLCLTSV